MAELSNDVKVIAAVITERKRQDMQWGGPDHDDTHSAGDWLRYMGQQATKITCGRTQGHNVRECFIKIAALAVAAVESLDRKNGKA